MVPATDVTVIISSGVIWACFFCYSIGERPLLIWLAPSVILFVVAALFLLAQPHWIFGTNTKERDSSIS